MGGKTRRGRLWSSSLRHQSQELCFNYFIKHMKKSLSQFYIIPFLKNVLNPRGVISAINPLA